MGKFQFGSSLGQEALEVLRGRRGIDRSVGRAYVKQDVHIGAAKGLGACDGTEYFNQFVGGIALKEPVFRQNCQRLTLNRCDQNLAEMALKTSSNMLESVVGQLVAIGCTEC
ncbi:hypothetical protein TZ53_24685 (plasmid) [Sphingobium sp. YBL2]|nr:hypothetical protein TZ53_24685 [Sphingobium sp. YBL2]